MSNTNKTITMKNIKEINIYDYVKNEENIDLIVNMLLHLQKSENALKWKQEAYGERCKEIDKLKTEVDWLYKNNEHYISQLNEKKKEIEKLKEIIEKK